MPRMSYHAVQLMFAAYDQWRRAVVDFARPNALTLDSISAVVLAAAATEGFINELAGHMDFYRRLNPGLVPDGEQKERLFKLAGVVLDLEERHRPVTEKYAAAWFTLTGQCAEPGRAPFQAFHLLHRLRDELMHLKVATDDEKHSGREITNALAQQGIALKGDKAGDLEWFDRLETPEVAGWACVTARKIIMTILEASPPHPTIHFDPLDLWRGIFCANHPGVDEPAWGIRSTIRIVGTVEANACSRLIGNFLSQDVQ
jgi:hypothetical protein